MITRHGLDDKFVHYSPPLCLPSDIRMETWNDIVRCTWILNSVTCPTCVYYLIHPEARALEQQYRRDTNK